MEERIKAVLETIRPALQADGGDVDWPLAELLALGTLLEEGVPVRDMRTIAETLAVHGGQGQDSDAVTARVRVALGASIFQTVNGTAREMSVMALDSQLEQILLSSMQGSFHLWSVSQLPSSTISWKRGNIFC